MKSRHKVLVFPSWRDNPYLNILSLAPRTAGYEFIGATRIDSLFGQAERLHAGDVLHIHWTSPLVQDSPDHATAIARISKLEKRIPELLAAGIRIVWTIHNRLPHELKYEEEEFRLYRLLSTSASVVHIMNPSTADVLDEVCTIASEKIRVIPHPSYQGIYPASPHPTSARAAFDLGADDIAVLFLGQIRPYKGIDVLVDAVTRATDAEADARVILLMAGTTKETPPEEIQALIPDRVESRLHLEFVDDADVPQWFAAADLAVLPYRAILNSGSAHLAATFGVPVVLPDEPHLRAQFREDRWVRFFDTDNAAVDIARLISDRAYLGSLTKDDFAEFNARLSPWHISNQYLDVLEGLTQNHTTV